MNMEYGRSSVLDLAESVDDLICTFDSAGDTTMDTLAMFVFGWALAALFLLWLGKILYNRFLNRANSKSKIEQPVKVDADPKAPASTATSSTGDAVDAKSAKQATAVPSAPVAVPKGGKGGYVPPTPPVRKRLTRQSPGPELNRKPKYYPAPTCTGADNVSVLWVNDVFQWLYNDLVVVNELLSVWIQSLNDYTRKAAGEQGVGVEFIRILPETHPPTLSNLFCECASNDDVTITCDCEAYPAFQFKCTRQKGDKNETSHYRVNVNRFRARLNIFCVSEKLQADLKCDGWPEIKVALAPVGNIKNNLDETHLQELLNELITNALRHTEVHLNLALYAACPRLIRHVATPGHMLPLHYDSMLNAYTSAPNHLGGMGMHRVGDKRLLVKVIRAAQLGAATGCTEPFCVVEMDEPPQKNQTSVSKNTNSPYWDEHFLFDLSPTTAELLFEVYDHAVKPHRFLGLAIVGVEELLINPSQRQIISLQSRPYESDPVSGTLTIEFLFIEGADIPNVGSNQPYKIKESIRTVSPNRPPNLNASFRNEPLTNGNHLLSPNMRNIGQYNGPGSNPDKLVIHSVQRQPSQRLVKSGDIVTSVTTTRSLQHSNYQQQQQPQDLNNDPRGRSRKRRDFFGTIKRRLGKSKTRSKSAGPENDVGRDDSLSRSISADRNRGVEDSYRLNVPPGIRHEENSRRSSLSEASGLSSASTRTYVNEASTLVLETIENGVKKHYLVPLSLAQKSKWRKKGTKLHIFNDHTFVAKHLTGGTVCQVCSKNIARRIGKQGYECRDCLLKCHKHCHVKVNDNCPQSTIHNIELSYISNPYTDKNLRLI